MKPPIVFFPSLVLISFSQFVKGHLISLLNVIRKIKEHIGNATYQGDRNGAIKKDTALPTIIHM